jgi:hypothetical protein
MNSGKRFATYRLLKRRTSGMTKKLTRKLNIAGRFSALGLASLLVIPLASVCGEVDEPESTEQLGSYTPVETVVEQALLSGRVVDSNGNVIVGAMIEIEQDGESLIDYSDDDGEFTRDVYPGDYRVSVLGYGYVPLHMSGIAYADNNDDLDLVLYETEQEGSFDTIEGTAILHQNALLTLPARAFVYEDGTPVTGDVDFSLTYFAGDSESDLDRLPGDAAYVGFLGVLDVEFFASWEPINLAPGITATIQIPATGLTVDDFAPYHYWFDPISFSWIQEGQGRLVDTENGVVWQVEVDHFSAHGAGGKVTLCHIPPGSPSDLRELRVAVAAVAGHLENRGGHHNGCYIGACGGVATASPGPGDDGNPVLNVGGGGTGGGGTSGSGSGGSGGDVSIGDTCVNNADCASGLCWNGACADH